MFPRFPQHDNFLCKCLRITFKCFTLPNITNPHNCFSYHNLVHCEKSSSKYSPFSSCDQNFNLRLSGSAVLLYMCFWQFFHYVRNNLLLWVRSFLLSFCLFDWDLGIIKFKLFFDLHTFAFIFTRI